MRSREFDNKEVLKTVMSVFWQKGYTATSIDDLTQQTGISRSGLYGEFKSKKGLFVEASKVYEQMVVDAVIGSIEGSDLGLLAIRQTFDKVCSSAQAKERLGCLICNASSEASWHDKEIATIVVRFHKRVRAAFLRCLENAQCLNEIPLTADVEAKADFLLASFQGLAHAIRSPMSPKVIRNYVDGVMGAVC